MKKRFLATLLALVMLLTLLPATALAYEITRVPLTLTVSSYGAPFYSPGTGEHTVSSIRVTKYINKSAVGSSNASGSARAYFTGSNATGWDLCMDIEIGNFKTTLSGSDVSRARITNKDMSGASGYVTFGLSFNSSGGTSTYLSITGGTALPEPETDYTLSYNANGGTSAPGAQTGSSTTGSYTFTVASGVPTWENHTFLGWATTSGATAAAYSAGDTITLQKNSPSQTLYAVWQEDAIPTDYTLSYDANGGTDAPAADTASTTEASHTFTVASAEPTWENHTFLGWADAATADTAAYQGGEEITLYAAAPAKTLYAVWEKSTANIPEAPGGELSGALDGAFVQVHCTNESAAHQDRTYGLLSGGYTAGAVQGNDVDGYTCAVMIQPDAYAAQYSVDTGTPHGTADEQGSVSITLQYDAGTETWTTSAMAVVSVACESVPADPQKQITVSFQDPDTAADIIAPVALTAEHPAVVPPTEYEGKTITGWTLNDTPYTGGFNLTELAALVGDSGWAEDGDFLYAELTFEAVCGTPPAPETVTILFRVVNGTWADGTTADQQVEIEKGAALDAWIPTGMQPLEGFEGGAWDKDPAGVQTADAVYTYTFTEKGMTPPETYTVHFDSSGGSAVPSQTVAAGSPAVKPADPTRGGDTFLGWYFNGEPYDFTRPVTASLTLVAQWRTNGGSDDDDSYTLRYNTNGGEAIRSETGSRKWTKDYEDLPTPERSGFRFAGWYYDRDLRDKVTGDVSVNKATVTLYAAWRGGVADPGGTGVSNWLNTTDHIAFLHGYQDGTFAPNRNMSRAEVAQMFYNLLLNREVPTDVRYSDVKDGDWYAPAVRTLSALGILTGYQDGTFRPYRAVTRAEFTVIAMRFAALDRAGESAFGDVRPGDWYYDAVVTATGYGWIGGYDDGTFRPNAPITRAAVASIVDNMLGRSADEDFVDAHADELRQFSDLDEDYWAYYSIMEATNPHTYRQSGGAEDWRALQ